MLEQIVDENAALRRVAIAARNPKYDLFGNNCEHFARYIASGKRESHQVRGFVAFAAGLLLLIRLGR